MQVLPQISLQTIVPLFANVLFRREAYKFYSALAPAGFVCSIGINTFSEIINSCDGFVDNQTFKLSDLDLEFVATNAGVKNNNGRNPDRQLVRYQLMEVLVRLSFDKFIKSNNYTLLILKY